MVTAGGPSYRPLLEMDAGQVRDALGDHVGLDLEVARNAVGRVRPGGSLVFMGGTGGAVHLMTNTALTGATFDIDGGQQFVS